MPTAPRKYYISSDKITPSYGREVPEDGTEVAKSVYDKAVIDFDLLINGDPIAIAAETAAYIAERDELRASAYAKHVLQFGDNAYTPEEWRELYGYLPAIKATKK